MAANCPDAGKCGCSCVRNKGISCAIVKEIGERSHCGNHGSGCHHNCTTPPGGTRWTPPKPPKKIPPRRIGRTNRPETGGWCDCNCRGCKTNKNHCHKGPKCAGAKPDRGSGGTIRQRRCTCPCKDCKNGVNGCGDARCTGHYGAGG